LFTTIVSSSLNGSIPQKWFPIYVWCLSSSCFDKILNYLIGIGEKSKLKIGKNTFIINSKVMVEGMSMKIYGKEGERVDRFK